ncbi:hypothetical protein LJC18_00375 [Lachnospiraceae bacterium OttesenSCG-928-E19]|nr:hypothetical protein [Lachnospiraceae bacterium OttesenSCG-928-E19]
MSAKTLIATDLNPEELLASLQAEGLHLSNDELFAGLEIIKKFENIEK